MPTIFPEPITAWTSFLAILASSCWLLVTGDGVSDSDLAISIREGREFRAEVRGLFDEVSERIGALEARVAANEAEAKRQQR